MSTSPLGSQSNPILLGGRNRNDLYCKCDKCGVVEICSDEQEETDFYVTNGQNNGPLSCFGCLMEVINQTANAGRADFEAIRNAPGTST